MDFFNLASQIESYVISCRRHFHVHPELSDKEDNTVAFIMDALSDMGIEHVQVPQGGVLGFIHGAKPGKTVLLRADIDALPIQEAPDNGTFPKACVSEVSGVAHLCGHDAHTAMLLGVGKLLSEHPQEITGRVILFFQRGEEFGYGMDYMMRYLQKNRISVDGCWAMHVRPDLPVGQVGLVSGGVYAGSTSFFINIIGSGNTPPVDCAVAVVNALNSARMREVSPFESATLAVTQFTAGQLGGELANVCNIQGTCRYHSIERVGIPMKRAIADIVNSICRAYECEFTLRQSGPSRGVINDHTCVEIARRAVGDALGSECVVVPEPTMGGEDFSALAAYYPSVMALLGVFEPERGFTAPLHSPYFEANERAFCTGIAATAAYALAFLQHEQPIPFHGVTVDYDTYLKG